MTKDKNFDGRFFFGVKTTGIFCRPSCPPPTAKEGNVLYFNTIFGGLVQSDSLTMSSRKYLVKLQQ
jgi:AraC family transcriptional regulator of adaptative response / DNA-3-methyladenine glycosylase II